MNIRTYKGDFSYAIFQRGQIYYRQKKLKEVTCDGSGNYRFIVEGTKNYNVTASITPEGELSGLSCDCPYDRGYCKHLAAALIYLESIYDKTISNRSSNYARGLIRHYTERAVINAQEHGIRLVPELEATFEGLKYSLKIGREKLYVVNDIYDMYQAFQGRLNKKYGKELEFVHSPEVLDEQSSALLELTFSIFMTFKEGADRKRRFLIQGQDAVRFFQIVRESGVNYGRSHFDVKFSDPEISFDIAKTDTGRYFLRPVGKIEIFNAEQNFCIIIDSDKKQIFVCGREFTNAVGALLYAALKEELLISEKEIAAFYTAVIRPVSKYVKFSGLEVLSDFTPPELSARLYIDMDASGEVAARLEYLYGDEKFTPEQSKRKNPFCDHFAEASCELSIRNYFDIRDDKKNPYYIDGDDEIYRLLTEGIPSLSEKMEIYTTDRFSRKAVIRPAVRPALGVRPSGSVLELELTADGYTPEELRELLAAYRLGKKYHKLKDGSFSILDDGLSELFEITESLDISDKSLMKEKIRVPAFRMLYLDSLGSTSENVRIERSSEFRRQVSSYREMLDYSDKISVPEQLDGILREYQIYGFRWLKTLSAYGLGGILADDMGLGKTLQAIALMLDEKRSKGGRSLVVCPASLVLNWQGEIEKFAPELRALAVMGTASERAAQFAEMEKYDVVITSYSLIARDFTEYQEHEFRYEFLDEAQYIKNSSTQTAKAVKSVNSHCRFALTGTPVENSFAELWSIFDYIMPDYLFSYRYFRQHYESPVVKDANEQAKQSLQRIVKPFILRRMKSGVLTELPEKTETVLLSEMEKEQGGIYSANVAEVRSAVTASNGDNTEKIKILAMLTRLRQICCDPALVYDNYTGKSAKLEQCVELVESCVNSGHKLLLFSQFTSMLDIVAARLDGMGIRYFMLTGSTKPAQRLKMVNSFNGDDTSVFLISLKAGGTGLNLTGADVVIHYDPWWNSSAENQASDRAYRIGQKKNVQIYKLITRNTIEEKIRELQQAKSGLADIVLSGGENSGNIMSMTSEEILELLK